MDVSRVTESEYPRAEADFRDLLPRGMIWIYLIASPITGYLFDPRPWTTTETVIRSLAANYVPFIVIPLLGHSLYHWVMPKILVRMRSGTTEIAAHLGAALPLGVVGALISWPPFRLFEHADTNFSRYLVICVLFSVLVCLPAPAIQRLRARVRDSERHAQQERRVALESQLQALQARTNPHFLFNSINTVASLIPDDPALAEETLERLAELFRYALDSNKSRLVPLRRELEVVEDYLHVQKVRYAERLCWAIEIDDEVDTNSVSLPPLTLQPLVENAVLHGVGQQPAGGKVEVRIALDQGRLICTISDDGPGESAHQAGSGTAIKEMRSRLELIYGADGHLSVGRLPSGGFRATISLPTSSTA